MGGARPPPQSRGSQISPVLGSYQCTMPSAQEPKVCMPVQVERAGVARKSSARAERRDLGAIVEDWCVVGGCG